MENNKKFNPEDSLSLNQMNAMVMLEKQNKEKIEQFKKRLEQFSEILELDEAKELLKKTMPVANEKNIFYVGNARCVVINKQDILRISMDTPNEFIAYDFVK